MKRKISLSIALILAICIIIAQMVTVFAASPSLSVGGVSGEPGDTIEVPVVIANNPGVVAVRLMIKYDDSVLTLKSVEDEGLLPGAVHSPTYEKNPYTLYWINGTAPENFMVNGTLATLTFEIEKDAKPGTTTLTVEQDNRDFDLKKVVFDVSDTKVTILDAEQNPTQPSEHETETSIPTDEPATDSTDTTAPTDEPATDATDATEPTDEPATDATDATDATEPTDTSSTAAPGGNNNAGGNGGSTGNGSSVTGTQSTGSNSGATGKVATGDSMSVVMLMVILMLSVAATAVCVSKKRRNG